MLRNPGGLAGAVVPLLAANAAVDVVLGLFDIRFLVVGDQSGDFDAAVIGGADLNPLYSLAFMLYVATGVVFIVWFHRLRQNAQVWAGDQQERGVGWAIGGWFVPIGNLWIPRGIAADIWRASRFAPTAADRPGELSLINAWWGFWVASTLVNWMSGVLFRGAADAAAYTAATWWSATGYGLDIVAALYAIRFVRCLTSMQHARATGMIPAAQ
ncbi:DUF4328 domain-containing protein [Streptomyces sp. NPDC127092]|uniref:DUF4328 domain-containing protein n=1 Tax=Streptomyces sp. NPDC127092 TaxID=3347135 RepID=UPI003656D1B8